MRSTNMKTLVSA